MKNRSIVKAMWTICVMGLLNSCMGLQDTTPIETLMPEIQSFNVFSEDGYAFELSATLSKEDAAKIVECGFYVSGQKSMQGAEKIESKLIDQEFRAEISLSEEGEKKYVCAYLSIGTDYVDICSDVKTLVAGEILLENNPDADLPKNTTANCYIVSKVGTYSFQTVKGNSSVSVGQVKSVEVLWESFGTSTAPNVGDLIKSVSYSDGYVTYKTADIFKQGNAVIAVKDAYGKILWSWHIWLTDEPGTNSLKYSHQLMMDRNLGATSKYGGAIGLLYQWGRKDPFLGSSSKNSCVKAMSTITWPSPVSSSSSLGKIQYAVENPTTFITCNSNNGDWYYSNDSSTDNTRWQSAKTIYDPCPAGWRVPDGGFNGIWEDADFDSQSFDSYWLGLCFETGAFFPAAGYRDESGGHLCGTGKYGYYWSFTTISPSANALFFNDGGGVRTTDSYYRASGFSVRCIPE